MLVAHHHHHHPSCQMASWAATKLLHPCLSLASLWIVPELWSMFFISASTVLCQVVCGRPHFCFPSDIQWIATLTMDFGILVQHVPNPGPSLPGDGGLHILLLALCWEVMAGNGSWPKDASDFPAACHVKGRQLGKVKLGHRPALWSIQNGQQYAALVELQRSLDSVLWWPPDYIHSIRWLPLVYCSHGFSSENAF